MSKVDEQAEAVEAVEPADAFGLVADETRLDILQALWKLEEPARFSDVREEVGTRDSAHFNYHLGKLTGQFVRKRDEGYELRTAGMQVVQSVLSGTFTEDPDLEIAMEDPCQRCGETLQAVYSDEMVTIECPSCGHGHGEYPFPPAGLKDRSDEEILDAFDQRVRHLHCLAKDGVCPACSGRMETTIERDEPCCLGMSVRARHTCQRCGHDLCAAVGLGLLDQSNVVTFCGERCLGLSETPYWQLPWCVDDEPVTVLSEDPWEIQVDVEVGGDILEVVLDGDLEVLETRQS